MSRATRGTCHSVVSRSEAPEAVRQKRQTVGGKCQVKFVAPARLSTDHHKSHVVSKIVASARCSPENQKPQVASTNEVVKDGFCLRCAKCVSCAVLRCIIGHRISHWWDGSDRPSLRKPCATVQTFFFIFLGMSGTSARFPSIFSVFVL